MDNEFMVDKQKAFVTIVSVMLFCLPAPRRRRRHNQTQGLPLTVA